MYLHFHLSMIPPTNNHTTILLLSKKYFLRYQNFDTFEYERISWSLILIFRSQMVILHLKFILEKREIIFFFYMWYTILHIWSVFIFFFLLEFTIFAHLYLLYHVCFPLVIHIRQRRTWKLQISRNKKQKTR